MTEAPLTHSLNLHSLGKMHQVLRWALRPGTGMQTLTCDSVTQE